MKYLSGVPVSPWPYPQMLNLPEKNESLLQTFINYGHKRFYNIEPRPALPSSTTSTCSAPSPWPPSTSLLEKWFELSSQKLRQAEIRTVDNWMKDGKLNVDRQMGSSECRLVDTNLAERRQPVSMLAENMLIDNSLGENRMAEHIAAESRLVVSNLVEGRTSKYVGRM